VLWANTLFSIAIKTKRIITKRHDHSRPFSLRFERFLSLSRSLCLSRNDSHSLSVSLTDTPSFHLAAKLATHGRAQKAAQLAAQLYNGSGPEGWGYHLHNPAEERGCPNGWQRSKHSVKLNMQPRDLARNLLRTTYVSRQPATELTTDNGAPILGELVPRLSSPERMINADFRKDCVRANTD
jgi:hypothetical protein